MTSFGVFPGSSVTFDKSSHKTSMSWTLLAVTVGVTFCGGSGVTGESWCRLLASLPVWLRLAMFLIFSS